MDRLREANHCVGTHNKNIFHSGRTDNLNIGRVVVFVTRKVEETLLELKPVNGRLMKVIFNSKFAKLTIIECYAPTEEAEEEEKE